MLGEKEPRSGLSQQQSSNKHPNMTANLTLTQRARDSHHGAQSQRYAVTEKEWMGVSGVSLQQ